jgi:hypothetical protein
MIKDATDILIFNTVNLLLFITHYAMSGWEAVSKLQIPAAEKIVVWLACGYNAIKIFEFFYHKYQAYKNRIK